MFTNRSRSLRIASSLLAGAACLAYGVAVRAQVHYAASINTVLGTGTSGNSGDGGPGVKGQITNGMRQLAVDAQGNVYATDTTVNVIRRVDARTGIVTTIAGNGTACSNAAATTGACGDGGLATAAQLSNARGIAIDSSGNIYLADYNDARIRMVNSATGIITTVAGKGTTCSSPSTNACGDGIVATAAQISYPSAVALDGLGNLYIADSVDYKIRKVVLSTGIISTVAGTGVSGYSGDGGPATAAAIKSVTGLACDSTGNLYIADNGNYRVRMIRASDKTISTIAGTGTAGTLTTEGNGGLASSALLGSPYNLAVDTAGNVYVADSGVNQIREILSTSAGASPTFGNIVLFAGTGTNSSTGDGGSPLKASFADPAGVAIDIFGNVFVADAYGARVRKISLTIPLAATAVGSSTSAAVSFDIQNTNAVTYTSSGFPSGFAEFSVGTPSGCALNSAVAAGTTCSIPFNFTPKFPGLRLAPYRLADSSGNLYPLGIAGYGLAPQVAFTSGTIAAFAGTGTAGFTGDGNAAASALLNAPASAVVDNAGNLYIADAGNHVVRRVDASTGKISTVAGTGTSGFTGDGGAATAATLNKPQALALDAVGNLYIADTGNHAIREVLSATGVISTVAGGNGNGTGGDHGPAISAKLSSPAGLAADINGSIYIADTGNHQVRQLNTATGIITTIAGTGVAGNSGDGAAATAAQLNAPVGLALTANGLLYIASSMAHTVRVLNLSSALISAVAGTGTAGYVGDGALATQAQLNAPLGLAVDAAGNLTIADSGNHVLRRVNASTKFINTVVGTGQSGSAGDGSAATSATLTTPSGIALDSAANIFVPDSGANVVRRIDTSKGATIAFGNQGLFATSPAKSLLVSNTGNQPLTLSNVTVTGNFVQSLTGDCSSGTVLAAGASCAVSLTFEPLVTGGATGTVSVTDNSLNGTVTQVTPLSATGVPSTNALLKSVAGNNQAVKLNTLLAIPLQVQVTDANGVGLAGQSILFTAPTSGAAGSFTGGATATATSDANGFATAPAFTANATTGAYVVTASFASAANTVSFNLTNVLNQYATSTVLAIAPVGTSFQYGQPLTLTATVAPPSQSGSTVSGSVYFDDGTTVVNTAPINNASASSTVTLPGVGVHPYQAVYAGDLNFAPSSSAITSITITPAQTALVSNHISVYYGQSTATFTLAGPFSGGVIPPPSGNFSYLLGTASTVNGTLVAGKANIAVPITLAVGDYPITITYAGDGNYQAAVLTGTLTVLTPSFSIAASSNALVLTLGSMASDTLTVTPLGNLPGLVTLSCSGLPLYTACVFNTVGVSINNPANALTFNGSSAPQTVQFTVVSQPATGELKGNSTLVFACMAPGLLVLCLYARRKRPALWLFCLGGCCLLALQGCGDAKTPAPGPFTGMTTFTITATGNANNVVQTTAVALTVQAN